MEHDHIKSKLIDFNLDKKQEKYAYSNFDVQFQLQNTNSIQNEGFVDMNERIKKINDKISNYENKIKGRIK